MIANMIHIDKHRSLTHFTRYIKYGKSLYENGDEKPHSRSKAHILSDVLQRLNDRANLLEDVVTCDETRIFQCDQYNTL